MELLKVDDSTHCHVIFFKTMANVNIDWPSEKNPAGAKNNTNQA